ncbi:hypothetical protein B0H13DRAFT_2309699 [Mycena leptocephala]|nr:hypothetical protein B0H13DRAFT_2309699 [Mycena leptocephala]
MTVFWIALFVAPLFCKINSGHAWSLHLRDDSGSDSTPATPCDQVCAPVSVAEGKTNNDTLCTDTGVQQYAQCLDCSDQLNGEDSTESQDVIDKLATAFVTDCTGDGHPVHDATVSGSFKGSVGPAGGGSPTQSASAPSTASDPAVSGQGNTKSNSGSGTVQSMGVRTLSLAIFAVVLFDPLSGY